MSRAIANEAAEAWNQAHPVGTDVTVRLYHGEILTSRTLTNAYVSEMGDAVIEVEEMEGVIGGYFLLSNVAAGAELIDN